MTVLFWVSVTLLAYAYLGYPLLLAVGARIKPRALQRQAITPRVSIIIAARNEADKIRAKIEHTLGFVYPERQMEVLVASDASDDGTDEIVDQYSARGVHLVRAPQRRGKEHAQGLAVAAATGEILVFTDAAAILEADALGQLVQNFADASIGAVSTEDYLVDAAGNPTAEGAYVKYEMWVRRLESRFHSLVGLSGSCFAIRAGLCADWSPTLASDFMGALRAARRGYRAITDPSVRARFVAVTSARAEMRRKIRTFLRGITVLFANVDLLDPVHYGRFAIELASHKLLRFVAPFLLLGAFVTSAAGGRNKALVLSFWLQLGFYAIAGAGGLIPSLRRYRAVRIAYYFTMAQCAMLLAWAKYGAGHQQVAWEPSKRHHIAASETSR